jgi:hypothetical protein
MGSLQFRSPVAISRGGRTFFWTITPLLAASWLAGCSGGTGDPSPTATPVTLSGTAATGAPLTGATLDVRNAQGAVICSTTVAQDGGYSCTLPAQAAGPFVVTARLGETTLVSATATTSSGTVNVTPLTHLIAARLATDGDPLALTNGTQLSASQLDAATTAITNALGSLRTALGDTTHPINGQFTASGSAHDRVLDAVLVNVRPAAQVGGAAQAATVDITIKTRPASDTAEPLQVSFGVTDTTLPSLPAVSNADLPGANVAARMQQLVNGLTSCHAVPLAQRVSGSNVTATTCRELFAGNDPTAYLHYGQRVGPEAAYASLFEASGTGSTFDKPAIESQRANGDLVVSYRRTTADGLVDTQRVVVTEQSNTYKLIGNQNQHGGRVDAYVQRRDFVRYPAYNYFSTGYNVVIPNELDGQGNSRFDRVVVTTPRQNSFTYRPEAGSASLQLARGNGTTYNTSVMRLAAGYENASTQGNPAQREPNLAFAATQWTDSELAAIQDQGVWRFDYYYADGVTPARTEYDRTASRAPTLAEARAMRYAMPTPAARQQLVASAPLGYVLFASAPASADANRFELSVNGGAWWSVADGAASPTVAQVFGALLPLGVGARFDDRIDVSPAARSTTVPCTRQSGSDAHCDATFPNSYAAGAYVHSIDLTTRTQKRLQISSMFATYNPANQ